MAELAQLLQQHPQMKLWVQGFRADGEDDNLEVERARLFFRSIFIVSSTRVLRAL